MSGEREKKGRDNPIQLHNRSGLLDGDDDEMEVEGSQAALPRSRSGSTSSCFKSCLLKVLFKEVFSDIIFNFLKEINIFYKL